MRTKLLRKMVKSSWIIVLLVLVLGTCVFAAEESFLADQHSKMGCKACHTDGEYGDVANDPCLKCHGSWEKLAEKTSAIQINPHKSPHFGMDTCTMCHHGHYEFENVCSSCHKG